MVVFFDLIYSHFDFIFIIFKETLMDWLVLFTFTLYRIINIIIIIINKYTILLHKIVLYGLVTVLCFIAPTW